MEQLKSCAKAVLAAVMQMFRRLAAYVHEELMLKDPVDPEEGRKDYSLVSLINKAHREWLQAKQLFDEVRDPDLIDYAIYTIDAAEKKYMYLLKEAKKEKISDERIKQYCRETGLA